jgi:ligand-binding sensor domain-containing protein/signal transduction histidine kinase
MRAHPAVPSVLAGALVTRTAVLSVLAAAMLASGVSAQVLPFRRYDIEEGLANSRVNSVFQDSRGYLWFATWEGLSRFDGAEFRNYGTREGLPSFLVNGVAEDARGRIWVATQGGGVARLLDQAERPAGNPTSMFESHRVGPEREANIVIGILFDRAGNLWCGCESGIYRARIDAGAALSFEKVHEDAAADSKQFGCVDERGRIWLGTKNGIVEFEGSTVIARHSPPDSEKASPLPLALVRSRGGILALYSKEVFELDREEGDGAGVRWRRLPIEFAPGQEARCAAFTSRDTLWIGTTLGLIRWRDGEQTSLARENGLPDPIIRSVLEDRDKNLWMATWSSGVAKLSGEGFLTYVSPEAMPDRNALEVLEAKDGTIYATGANGIVRVESGGLGLVEGSDDPRYRSIGSRFAQDTRGDFWVGTQDGICRFEGPRLDMRTPVVLGEAQGIPRAEVFATVYRDPRGRMWFATLDGFLNEWDPDRNEPRFERTPLPGTFLPPRAIFLDRGGRLWLAPYVGLLRDVGGIIEPLGPCEGLTNLETRCLFEDHGGRLWIGTRFKGVSVTDEPGAPRPRFRNYSTASGLASDAVWSIAEDDEGRIYLGTSRGVERLDVQTGAVRHFTSFDGLAGDIVNCLVRDRRGYIWAATSGGLSRLDPRAETEPGTVPPIYISRARIAGEDLALSETGETAVPEVSLPASKDNLLIEFVAPCFRDERDLAYQYRLEGVDEGWSPPSPMRSVNYARLASGTYRFCVRAVLPAGGASATPATFAFRIARPAWQQPWFIALVLLAAGGIAYALHRSRVRRILALEGIRTQIATDIHDDMGSGLSQIAILAEVAKREPGARAQGHMEEVARLARTLRDSMSDIVWAVDPRRDRFGDLVQRMRQAAFNLLEAEGLRVEFRAPGDAALEGLDLAPDRRRHLLLVLKESLSNVARHARASEVAIEIRVERGLLHLSIRDDGEGFDPASSTSGHGLTSLRQRAAKLGGTIRIDSRPGGGTGIDLEVPA